MNGLSIPVGHNPAFKFIVKGFGVYLLWYILYNMILSPAGGIDSWMEHYLVLSSSWLMSSLGYSVFTQGNVIGIHNLAGIEVTSGCDGFAAIGVFVSFIIAYPGDMRRRLFLILTGSILLLVANMLRICVLALGQFYWPGGFNFLHIYLTEAVFDGLVVALWVVWIKWGRGKVRSEDIVNPSGALG